MFSNPINKKRKLDSIHQKSNHETIDQNEENFYYIYESKKRNLTSNLRIKPTKFQAESKEDETLSFSLKPCSSERIRLFDMCLNFIALHLNLVDSLVGFPSIVGEDLFKECVKCSKFNSENRNLSLFADAYPEYLIKSINLSAKPSIFTSLVPIIEKCFIKQLDISNCNLNMLLTENNLNLSEILKNSAEFLEYLNLSSNQLNETFIQKFTLPQRVHLIDFQKLNEINLSKNLELNSGTIFQRYFLKFKNLSKISISCSKASKSDANFKFKVCSCSALELITLNSGWISNIALDKLDSKLDKVKDKNELINSSQGLISLH